MKTPLLIIDANRDGGSRERGPVMLPVQELLPSRYELFRQLCVARDWTAIWVVVAGAGWITVGILLWMKR